MTVKTHVPFPAQPPPVQPENPAPVAVSVTEVPLLNDAEQVDPHSRPAGFEVTVPLPARTTDNIRRLNEAVTFVLALIVKLHVCAVPAAAQAPLHPPNSEVASGVARRVRAVPDG